MREFSMSDTEEQPISCGFHHSTFLGHKLRGLLPCGVTEKPEISYFPRYGIIFESVPDT